MPSEPRTNIYPSAPSPSSPIAPKRYKNGPLPETHSFQSMVEFEQEDPVESRRLRPHRCSSRDEHRDRYKKHKDDAVGFFKWLACFIVGSFVLFKIVQYIWTINKGTYFDDTYDTKELGLRMTKRGYAIALNIYPGFNSLMTNLEINDKIMNKLDNELDWEKKHDLDNRTISKSQQAKFEEIFWTDQDKQQTINLRAECIKFWEQYYWDEYEWNRDFVKKQLKVDQGSLRYVVQLNDFASGEFEKQMEQRNSKLALKRRGVLDAFIRQFGYPKEEESDQDRRNAIDKIYQRDFEVKCYFKRGETAPYRDLEKDYWLLDRKGEDEQVILMTKQRLRKNIYKY